MAARPERSFRTRAFVAASALLTALGLPVTGFASHATAGEGLAGAHHAWMATHNALGLLFVVFAVWHLCLNGRAVLRHLRGSVGRVTMPSREALAALLLVAGMLTLAVGHTFAVPRGDRHPAAHVGSRR